jgi:hypothetical protein
MRMMRDDLDRNDELVLTAPKRRTVLEAELGRQLGLEEVIAEAWRLTIARARG